MVSQDIECLDCDGHGHPLGKPDLMLGATDETYSVGLWIARINGLQAHLRIIADSLPANAEWLRGQVDAAQREAARYVADFAPCPACGGTGWREPTQEEINDRAADAYSDMCESEPPITMQERYEIAAREKRELAA